jgi:hypothetical protein
MENQQNISTTTKKDGLSEEGRLIGVLLNDFSKHIEKETEPFVILLKGHLLLEYYLNQLLLLYSKEKIDVEKKGFFEKVTKLESINNKLFDEEVFSSLKKLNELRNRLSHSLGFKITESEIDTVGFCIGKEYVLTKYKNPSKEDFLLKWILKYIATDVFFPIYLEVAKSEKSKPTSNP